MLRLLLPLASAHLLVAFRFQAPEGGGPLAPQVWEPKTPYEWQLDAARRAQHENIIVNVATGLGKTLVGVLAIDEAMRREPTKKCAFIVETSRILARQQYLRLRNEQLAPPLARAVDPRRVALVTAVTVGSWGPADWKKSLSQADVFVGTPELFRRAFLEKGYFSFDDFSLIVVDECHHVRKDAPTAQTMRRLHADEVPSNRTRVLGLTASYAGASARSSDEFEKQRDDLQHVLQARFFDLQEVKPGVEPEFVRIMYHSDVDEMVLGSLADTVASHVWKELEENRVQSKEVRKITVQLATVLIELGRQAFLFALEYDVVEQVRAKADNFAYMQETWSVAERLRKALTTLKHALPSALERARRETADGFRGIGWDWDVSAKVRQIASTLRDEFAAHGSNPKFCGMVFVKEVSLAAPLAFLLANLTGQKVGVASGIQSMSEEVRNRAFDSFSDGTTKILVCTACAEEGVDVTATAFVVRFSEIATTKSHVQGAGRARQQNAKVFYLENDPHKEVAKARVMRDVAASPGQGGAGSAAFTRPWNVRIEGRHPFAVEGSDVEVNLGNAEGILRSYLTPFVPQRLQGAAMTWDDEVILPGPSGGLRILTADAVDWLGEEVPDSVPSARRAAYLAVLVLHRRGWLDAHNDQPAEVRSATCWPSFWERVPTLRVDPDWDPTQDIIGETWLHPSAVETSQAAVERAPDGTDILDDLVELCSGRADLGAVRVAMRDGTWYSTDGRRLLMYKVAAPIIGMGLMRVHIVARAPAFARRTDEPPTFGAVSTASFGVQQLRSQLCQRLGIPDGGQAATFGGGDDESEEDQTAPLARLTLRSGGGIAARVAMQELPRLRLPLSSVVQRIIPPGSVAPTQQEAALGRAPGIVPLGSVAPTPGTGSLPILQPQEGAPVPPVVHPAVQPAPVSPMSMPSNILASLSPRDLALPGYAPDEINLRVAIADEIRRIGSDVDAAISVLNKAAQRVTKSSDGVRYVDVRDWLVNGMKHFLVAVEVGGRSFEGRPDIKKKKAKEAAASAAIAGLLREAGHPPQQPATLRPPPGPAAPPASLLAAPLLDGGASAPIGGAAAPRTTDAAPRAAAPPPTAAPHAALWAAAAAAAPQPTDAAPWTAAAPWTTTWPPPGSAARAASPASLAAAPLLDGGVAAPIGGAPAGTAGAAPSLTTAAPWPAAPRAAAAPPATAAPQSAATAAAARRPEDAAPWATATAAAAAAAAPRPVAAIAEAARGAMRSSAAPGRAGAGAASGPRVAGTTSGSAAPGATAAAISMRPPRVTTRPGDRRAKSSTRTTTTTLDGQFDDASDDERQPVRFGGVLSHGDARPSFSPSSP